MKKFLPFIFLLFLIPQEGNSQKAYVDAIGIRAGNLAGISYKRFVGLPHTIEGILGYNYQNGRLVTLTGLYQYHIFLSYELNFFAGAGLTLGTGNSETRLLGEAMAGIEYTIPNVPLSFTMDYKPAFFIFNNEFFFNEFALTVRYILNQ
ncbi:MAG: hypothetical protein HKN16_00485 [Saprospiraceae bacterium]|nr:hypothetical protein [Saprospiraceae bacterium]